MLIEQLKAAGIGVFFQSNGVAIIRVITRHLPMLLLFPVHIDYSELTVFPGSLSGHSYCNCSLDVISLLRHKKTQAAQAQE